MSSTNHHENELDNIRMSENLPRTTGEAAKRYLQVYRKLFKGNVDECKRLEKMTKMAIGRLRKICPRFYETRLASVINQACCILTLYDTNNRQDAEDFHRTHSIFLAILGEFKNSQPQGDVDFHKEKKRYAEKKRLIKRYGQLKKELNAIDSSEITITPDGDYESTLNHRSKVTGELQNISIELALLECQDTANKSDVKLNAPPESMLSMLSLHELESLEAQMIEFSKKHKDRTALYSDVSIIKVMFDKLHFAPGRFRTEQIETMMKEAVTAHRAYFREIERAEWYSRYDQLLKSKPKTGDIFSPEELPEDLKRKMDELDAEGERKLDRMIESFAHRICEEKVALEDLVELSSDDSSEEKECLAIKRLKGEGILVDRIKEEPNRNLNQWFANDRVSQSDDEIEYLGIMPPKNASMETGTSS